MGLGPYTWGEIPKVQIKIKIKSNNIRDYFKFCHVSEGTNNVC